MVVVKLGEVHVLGDLYSGNQLYALPYLDTTEIGVPQDSDLLFCVPNLSLQKFDLVSAV